MAEALSYSFGERLQMSQGKVTGAKVDAILIANIPGALNVIPAHTHNDRSGTDWWVEMRGGNFLSVDAKVRSKDWLHNGKDDLALETWSVVEARKVGWSRDINKRTDYVLWLWQDSGRWCLVPFQMLCAVFDKNWQFWRTEFQCNQQHTPSASGGYHSECVFVPRRFLWAEIYREFGGAA
jgi:hypothetical protein